MCRLWRVVWPLLVLLSLCRGALAQAEPRTVVDIVLVGKLGEDPVFAARVTSWFPAERFSVKVHRARYLDARQVLKPSADAAVHVWVTLTQDLARLYFSSAHDDSGGVSYFLRDLRLESGLDEIGAEHVAEVLNLSTQAFLDGQAQSAREEVERTLNAEPTSEPAAAQPAVAPVLVKGPTERDRPPPKPTPPRERRREWGAAVGYGVSYRADEGIWHGPRLSLGAVLAHQLGLRAAVQGALPQTRELTPLELRFYGASFLVAAAFRHHLAPGVELEWFAGPGLDVVRYDPVRPLSAQYATAKAATEARPEAALGLSAWFGHTPRFAVVLEASLPLTKTHYDLVEGSTRQVIAKASPVVPTLGVEVGF